VVFVHRENLSHRGAGYLLWERFQPRCFWLGDTEAKSIAAEIAPTVKSGGKKNPAEAGFFI
jgi:hypothetical protein